MSKALLIDKNYMALAVVGWKKAVKLLIKGKAEPIHYGAEHSDINCANGVFEIPSIIRLVGSVPWKAHSRRLNFSRRGVMVRDRHSCQYCGVKVGKHSITIDHVVPKARGGKTSYINCVACCRSCNIKKADKSLDEAGLKLLNKPQVPSFVALNRDYIGDAPPKEWEQFIIG